MSALGAAGEEAAGLQTDARGTAGAAQTAVTEVRGEATPVLDDSLEMMISSGPTIDTQ